jgi:hypothetical protein
VGDARQDPVLFEDVVRLPGELATERRAFDGYHGGQMAGAVCIGADGGTGDGGDGALVDDVEDEDAVRRGGMHVHGVEP